MSSVFPEAHLSRMIFPPVAQLKAHQPDIGKPLVERQIGGLGISLVRKMMDESEYRRESEKNVLILKTKVRET